MHDPTFDIPEEKPEEIYPPCKRCLGTGWLEFKYDSYGKINPYSIKCPSCDGDGYIIPEDDEIPY